MIRIVSNMSAHVSRGLKFRNALNLQSCFGMVCAGHCQATPRYIFHTTVEPLVCYLLSVTQPNSLGHVLAPLLHYDLAKGSAQLLKG